MVVKLTPRREIFCQQYVLTHNAAESARRAGYSVRRADRAGWEQLQRQDVKDRIQELYKLAHVSQEETVRKLAAMVRGDWTQWLRADPDTGQPYLDFMGLVKAGYGFLLQGFAVTDKGGIRWEMPNSQQALIELAKSVGVLNPAPPEEREANLAFRRLADALVASIEETDDGEEVDLETA